MNNTKVVATIDAPTCRDDMLKELFSSGMDVVRINMSYSNQESCLNLINKIDMLNKNYSKKLSIMLDLDGPRVRVNKIENGEAILEQGDKIRVYIDNIIGDKTKFSVNYSGFVNDVKVNDTIKVDDGKIVLKVIDNGTNYLLCEVLISGTIRDYATVNVPGTKLNIPFLSDNDKDNIVFASKHGVDFLSLSFVSTFEDVLSVNDLLIELGDDHMEVITKIENEQAFNDIDEILKISDGLIVARGDLGVEVPIERVPLMQKQIINKCHENGKVVIVSTEFLSSMENEMMPTRAEVSDVANAVLDGTDAIMLTGETAVGKYPLECLKIINKIIKATEGGISPNKSNPELAFEEHDTTGAVACSVVTCAEKLSAVAIVTPTISGYTAKKIGRLHSNFPVIAVSPNIETVKNLTLCYGVQPVFSSQIKDFDDIINVARECTKSMIQTSDGDRIIITGGYPFSMVKHTNFMKIEEL